MLLYHTGRPTSPMTVAGFIIYNLGEVVADQQRYNTDYTIYPSGNTVTHPYGHIEKMLRDLKITNENRSNNNEELSRCVPQLDTAVLFQCLKIKNMPVILNFICFHIAPDN